MARKPKLSGPTIPDVDDLSEIMAGLDVVPTTLAPAEQAALQPGTFVNEPIVDMSDAPTAPSDPELVSAAYSLDPFTYIEATDALTAKLFQFTTQDREAMIYGVVEMENSPAAVAETYKTDPEVVILAIQLDRLARMEHEHDVSRNWGPL